MCYFLTLNIYVCSMFLLFPYQSSMTKDSATNHAAVSLCTFSSTHWTSTCVWNIPVASVNFEIMIFESPVNFSWWEPIIVLYKEVLSSQLGKLHFLSDHILESRYKKLQWDLTYSGIKAWWRVTSFILSPTFGLVLFCIREYNFDANGSVIYLSL